LQILYAFGHIKANCGYYDCKEISKDLESVVCSKIKDNALTIEIDFDLKAVLTGLCLMLTSKLSKINVFTDKDEIKLTIFTE
jgi:hypothetical protein